MAGHAHGNMPADSYMAEIYWMFAGAFIAAAVLTHGKDLLEYRLRSVEAVQSGSETILMKSLECAKLRTRIVIRHDHRVHCRAHSQP